MRLHWPFGARRRCSRPDALIDEVGQEPVAEAEDDAAEIIDEFKDFIENVSPEDFQ